MASASSTLRTDPVTKVLGSFGKWQLRTMLIIFLCKVPTSWFMAIIIFTAPAPNPGDVWCTPPDSLPDEYLSDWISMAHPIKFDRRNHSSIDFCHVYVDLNENPLQYIGFNQSKQINSNSTTIECTNFTFHQNYHSLVVDFNLVCDRQLLTTLSQCFHIFGLLTGGIAAYIMLK